MTLRTVGVLSACIVVAGAAGLAAFHPVPPPQSSAGQQVLCPVQTRADGGGYYRVLRKTPDGQVHGVSRHVRPDKAGVQAHLAESANPRDSVWVQPPRIHSECPEDWNPWDALVDSIRLRPDRFQIIANGADSIFYVYEWRGAVIDTVRPEESYSSWLIYDSRGDVWCHGDCTWEGSPPLLVRAMLGDDAVDLPTTAPGGANDG